LPRRFLFGVSIGPRLTPEHEPRILRAGQFFPARIPERDARMSWLLLLIALVLPWPDEGENYPDPPVPVPSAAEVQARIPPMVALWSPDNDLALPGRDDYQIVMPNATVRAQLEESFVAHYLERAEAEAWLSWCYYTPPERFFGDVSLIRGPNGLDVYALRIHDSSHSQDDWLLFVHDREIDCITAKPAWIYGRWMGRGTAPLLEHPIVYFDDLDLDDYPELVFQSRTHNGTEDNTALYHYCHISEDLALTEILRVKDRDYRSFTCDEYVERKVRKVSRTSLRIDVLHTREGKRLEVMGYVWLEREDDPEARFQVTEKVPLAGEMRDIPFSEFLWDDY